jgi:hypothetical protein
MYLLYFRQEMIVVDEIVKVMASFLATLGMLLSSYLS